MLYSYLHRKWEINAITRLILAFCRYGELISKVPFVIRCLPKEKEITTQGYFIISPHIRIVYFPEFFLVEYKSFIVYILLCRLSEDSLQ